MEQILLRYNGINRRLFKFSSIKMGIQEFVEYFYLLQVMIDFYSKHMTSPTTIKQKPKLDEEFHDLKLEEAEFST